MSGSGCRRRAVVVWLVGALVAGCSSGGGGGAGGSDSEAAPVPTSPYAEGWSAVHADAANSDHSPVEGARDVTLAWQRSFDGSMTLGPLEWTINLGPTVELDREAMPGASVFSVGTTVSLDGTVCVATIVGELYAFRPARSGSDDVR